MDNTTSFPGLPMPPTDDVTVPAGNAFKGNGLLELDRGADSRVSGSALRLVVEEEKNARKVFLTVAKPSGAHVVAARESNAIANRELRHLVVAV